ncbi:MAG: hypothetical protein ACP5I1_15255 [Candidatus Hinthialibacter sp.]
MQIICFGYNDLRMLGDGWYGVERSPEGILYRSSGPSAEFFTLISAPVSLSLIASARPEHAGESLKGAIKGQENSGFEFILETNGWTVIHGSVIPGESRALRLSVENPWSPDRLYHNGDARALGILVSAVRMV